MVQEHGHAVGTEVANVCTSPAQDTTFRSSYMQTHMHEIRWHICYQSVVREHCHLFGDGSQVLIWQLILVYAPSIIQASPELLFHIVPSYHLSGRHCLLMHIFTSDQWPPSPFPTGSCWMQMDDVFAVLRGCLITGLCSFLAKFMG